VSEHSDGYGEGIRFAADPKLWVVEIHVSAYIYATIVVFVHGKNIG
jgi:hypothetical protein